MGYMHSSRVLHTYTSLICEKIAGVFINIKKKIVTIHISACARECVCVYMCVCVCVRALVRVCVNVCVLQTYIITYWPIYNIYEYVNSNVLV